MSLFSGTVTGVFYYFVDDGLTSLKILNVSVLIFIYLPTANFRHSHIWLSYGWLLSHVVYSPAMHWIHHSTAERHVDKNFGLFFSFCDYFAGTLYIPREQEELKLGLTSEEHKEYSSVCRLYVLPFKNAARLVIGGIKSWPRPRTGAEPPPEMPQRGPQPLSDQSSQV